MSYMDSASRKQHRYNAARSDHYGHVQITYDVSGDDRGGDGGILDMWTADNFTTRGEALQEIGRLHSLLAQAVSLAVFQCTSLSTKP